MILSMTAMKPSLHLPSLSPVAIMFCQNKQRASSGIARMQSLYFIDVSILLDMWITGVHQVHTVS